MTGLFKQQLVAQRDAESTARAKKIVGYLRDGGYNVAQEGIIETIKKAFKGDDEGQMKMLAKSAKELLGKINALDELLSSKKELKPNTPALRINKSARWLMVDGKVPTSDKFPDAVKDVMEVMTAITKDYIPKLDANVSKLIQKYLIPTYSGKFEKDLDLKKTLGWAEPASMYRLMTEKGPDNKYLKMATIQTKSYLGEWCIQGLAQPMPKYNIRMMHCDRAVNVPSPDTSIQCLTKDQVVAILGYMKEAVELIEGSVKSDGFFGQEEMKLRTVLDRAEKFIPADDDPDYMTASTIYSMGYTIYRRYDLIYDAEVATITSFVVLFKLCELSVSRMT